MKRITITDDSVNRYGFRVLTAGIRLENYRKNPVLLFGHNTESLPIGRLDDIRVEPNGSMTALPVFDENDKLALAIKDKFDNGFMFAASIHIEPITLSDDPKLALPGQTDSTVVECDLLEVSMVTIPGNTNAVVLSAHSTKAIPPLKSITSEMDLKKIATALGLSEDADEAAVLGAIANQKTLIAQLNADRVAGLVAAGESAGVVTTENKEAWTRLAAADFENTAALLKASKPASATPPPAAPPAQGATLVGMLSAGAPKAGTQQPNDDRAAWTFDDWNKRDPKGLLKLKSDEPDKYKTLALAYPGGK
jgi:hypothetical protein